MAIALLPLLAVLGLNSERTAAATDLEATSQPSSLSSAFNSLNLTVGGRLQSAVPFEQACFSVLEGQHVNASSTACATIQANYTDPLYRVAHFGAYMAVRSISRSVAVVAHLYFLLIRRHNGKHAKKLVFNVNSIR